MTAPIRFRDFGSARPEGRVWSLADMLEKNAGQFFQLAQTLTAISVILNDRIERSGKPEFGHSPIAERQLLEALSVHLDKVLVLCDELDLEFSAAPVGRLQVKLLGPYKPTYNECTEALGDINSRLKDQLETTMFLALSADEFKKYQPRNKPFGADFESKFKSAGAFELDEAMKCSALGRPTAAVFHLMRLLEIGIHAMCECLGIPPVTKPAEKNWGQLLGKLKAEIEAKWQGMARDQGDGKLFGDLLATLDAIKHPWRNATMHVENKYTDQEADHIMVAVRGFMMKLASRCDEGGSPKA